MPARVVDLRSDTVTHPTPAMREAMACAEVGDDGHGEDPTVQRLEALAAERLGKEAAVLVSSGTMGNLVGALTQTEPGDTMIVGAYCHPSLKAAAGIAVYGGVKPYEIPTERGRMDPADVRAAIRTVREADGGHPTLLCLENTHNQQHGSPLRPGGGRERKRGRARVRAARPRGRRPPVQCCRRAGRAGQRPRCRRGLGLVLPLEGSLVPGRIVAVWRCGLCRAGARRPQAGRRHDAPVRGNRGRRYCGA